jgi:serine protease
MKLRKGRLIWLAFLALGILLNLLLKRCQDYSPSTHAWSDCGITDHARVNIVDPRLDPDPRYDYVLIDFHRSVSKRRISSIANETGLDLKPTSHTGAKHNLYKARVPEGSVPLIHSHLTKHGYARYIKALDEKVRFHTLAWEPNDPLYSFQWNFEQVRAVEAWTMATGRGVVVAVLDTGIALEDDAERNIKGIRDLKGVSWVPGYDFIDNSTFAWDGHGHGTHVAGTIAQVTHNEYGVAGLAFGATLMPVRVLDSNGSGSSATVADGIRFAVDNGAHILNLSLGSSHACTIVEEAVQYARRKNVLVVAAAGNSGKKEPNYPAAHDHVLAVAATQYDKHTTFYSQRGVFVDIAAPGGNTNLDQDGDGRPDGIMQETVTPGKPNKHQFGIFMGTSMASPHVAAVAALVKEWGVTHPDAVKRVLQKTADRSMLQSDTPEKEDEDDRPLYSEKEFRERYGAGIVQADSAVTHAILEPGILRTLLALFFAMVLFVIARRGTLLEAEAKKVVIFFSSSVFFSAGLFMLPILVPFMEVVYVSKGVKILATPLPRWDWLFFGLGQTPILVSFALPLATIALLHGLKNVRYVAIGMATGVAAFCVAEVVLYTMPILWIPGGDMSGKAFLMMMATLNLLLAHFSLKGD